MGSLSIWHWLIVGAVVLLVFGGRNKISDMMGDVARGIKAFKKGMADDETADNSAKSDSAVKTIDHQAAADVKRRAQSERKGQNARGPRRLGFLSGGLRLTTPPGNPHVRDQLDGIPAHRHRRADCDRAEGAARGDAHTRAVDA